jgi:hypothetical protein
VNAYQVKLIGGSEKMLHVLKFGTKNIERFLERCTVRIPCTFCHGTGCAQCSGYGYMREIIDPKRIYEV